jgi:probable F420-dependent oxidoreductase
MRFSVQLPTDRVEAGADCLSGAAIAEMARAAEAAGFDAAFVTDHPAPDDRWLATGGHHTLDPFVVLSTAAAATTRLRLQTHVLVLAYRNPFLTAKAVASLDVVSGGRVIVGVAAGYLASEFAALGVDIEDRNALTDEAILAMKHIWTEQGVSLRGRGFDARDITSLPQPLQRPHPPIWVGGNSHRAIRRAVELGDGWLPFPAPRKWSGRVRTAALETLDDLRERLAYARTHAEKIGREAPLEVCFVPFGLGMGARSEAGDADRPERVRESVAALEALGVGWVTVAVPARSRAEFSERAAAFGEQVIAPLKG